MPERRRLDVILYMRSGCGLCDEVREQLLELQARFPHRSREIDIDDDPALQARYFDQIPVVVVGQQVLRAPISHQALAVALSSASGGSQRQQAVDGTNPPQRDPKAGAISRGSRLYYWLSRHYLALLNLIIFLYVGLPFVAPALMKVGRPGLARVIYTLYSPLCHQFGFRSFFLFGAQAYYPLQEAGLSVSTTFEQATGLKDLSDPYSVSRLSARRYTGDAVVGYKVALCERDVAIYAAILLFGLLYGLTGRRLPGLPWPAWALMGLAPIGLDGVSQIVSQFNLPGLAAVLPYRESTPLLRVLTGGLFGFATAWFALQNIEESMRDTRHYFSEQLAARS